MKPPAVRVVPILSHALLTSLSGIVVWCEMLRRKEDPPEIVGRGITAIDRSARTQVAILDNLVELSSAQAGSTDLQRARLDLLAGVRDVVARSASGARQRHVEIRFTPPAAHGPFHGDPVRLRTALYNIVDNAIAASPDGGQVEIALDETPDGISLRVMDQGSGIPPEKMPGLFELKELTEGGRGRLGLGLPIARRIVELHGGSIAIAGNSPQGCRVTFAFR